MSKCRAASLVSLAKLIFQPLIGPSETIRPAAWRISTGVA